MKEALFRTFLLPNIFGCCYSIVMLMKDFSFSLASIISVFIVASMLGVIPFLVVYLVIGRAFHLVVLNEEGIRDGTTFLHWNEIGFVKTIETKYFRDKLYKPLIVELICIAQNQGEYSFHTNTSHCILIEKNLKNFEILAQYSKGNSSAINSYLDSFFYSQNQGTIL